jgi:hypothetical protein
MYFCSGQPTHFCSGVDTLIMPHENAGLVAFCARIQIGAA